MSLIQSILGSPTISKTEDPFMYMLEDTDEALHPISRKTETDIVKIPEMITENSNENVIGRHSSSDVSMIASDSEENMHGEIPKEEKIKRKCQRSLDAKVESFFSKTVPLRVRRSLRIQELKKVKYTYSSSEISGDECEEISKPREFLKEATNTKPQTVLKKCNVKLLQISQSQLFQHTLKNSDNDVLEYMIEQNSGEEEINDIIRNLPIESILPLLKVFYHQMQEGVPLEFGYSKWLKAFYHNHLPYLISSEEGMEVLEAMNACVDAKTKNLDKILQLRGKIEMILMQAKKNREKQDINEDSKENLKVFVDESVNEISERLDEILVKGTEESYNENVPWACEIQFQKPKPSYKWVWTQID